MLRARVLVPVALLTSLIAGCGGDETPRDPVTSVDSSVRRQVSAAHDVQATSFPKPSPDQALEDFAGQFDTSEDIQAIQASSIFTPPSSRLAFGLLTGKQRFVYGKTVVYLQRRDGGPIVGPIPAPADVLVTPPRYRSRQSASETDPFAAIYETTLPVRRPGVWNVLAVSQLRHKRIASPMAIQVSSRAADPIPDVGEHAPKVQTDTLGSVKGNMGLLDTRQPPAPELARKSFADVVGKKPVALLFATPQLCQSRVCGPVTDEMLQMRASYGDRMTFIHQEVYKGNDPGKGLRDPLKQFKLPSEPWLFTVDADGKIAARLEGSIGHDDFERAVKAALR